MYLCCKNGWECDCQALLKASEDGKEKIVEELIKAGADVTATDEVFPPILHLTFTFTLTVTVTVALVLVLTSTSTSLHPHSHRHAPSPLILALMPALIIDYLHRYPQLQQLHLQSYPYSLFQPDPDSHPYHHPN